MACHAEEIEKRHGNREVKGLANDFLPDVCLEPQHLERRLLGEAIKRSGVETDPVERLRVWND